MTNDSTAKRARDNNDGIQEDRRPAKRVAYVLTFLTAFTSAGAEANHGHSEIDDFDNLITVLVGSEEHRFMLHQDAICGKSKFFTAACSKKWREGQERLVRLPEIRPSTFKIYCGWVYTGQIADIAHTRESDKDDRVAEKSQLVDLYLVADALDDIKLRNLAVSTLFKSMQVHGTILSAVAIQWIWRATPSGSNIRKMLVDVTVSRMKDTSFEGYLLQYPPEFVQDVAVAAMKIRPMLS